LRDGDRIGPRLEKHTGSFFFGGVLTTTGLV